MFSFAQGIKEKYQKALASETQARATVDRHSFENRRPDAF